MPGDCTQDDVSTSAPAVDSRKLHYRSWWIVLAVFPAFLPPYVIWKYHVPFIWNDAWDVAALLVKAQRGILSLSDFWTPHLEHRMPIPYGIMFVLARLTDWNTYAEVLFGYLIICLLSVLFAMLLRTRHLEGSGRKPTWVWQWFLINMLIFSPIQAENWIFGFTACQNFIAVPCIVGAMVLFDRRGVNWKTLAVAGVLVEVAVCSQANGLLGWFVLLPFVVNVTSWQEIRQRQWLILGWIGLATVSFVTYFIGYEPHQVISRYYQASLLTRVQFFLAFLGTPLCFSSVAQSGLAAAVGAVLVLMYIGIVVLMVRRWMKGDQAWLDRAMPWLALGLYSLANAAMAAWGRAGIGLEQAAATRYTTISICLLICFVGIMLLIARSGIWHRPVPILSRVFSAILLITLTASAIRTRGTYVESTHERLAGLAHLSFIRILFEPMGGLLISYDPKLAEHALVLDQMGYLHPPLIRDPDIQKLEALGWDADAASALSGLVEGGRQLPDGTIQIWGWAVLHEKRRLADAVLITYDGANNEAILCAIGDVRVPQSNPIPVVGQGRPNATWIAAVPLNRIPHGSRRLRCWAYDARLQKAYPLSGVSLQTGGG